MLTDLERAARFIYLQRTAFGGKVDGRHFGVSPDRPGRFDITQLRPMLEDLHQRLAGAGDQGQCRGAGGGGDRNAGGLERGSG